MDFKRMIIVANRLPFHISVKKDILNFSPSAGGLVTSIKSYIDNRKDLFHASGENFPLWIGTSEISEKRFRAGARARNVLNENFDLHPVFLPHVTKEKFYNGFCNDTIWPLFHYFPSYANYREDYWQEYINANKAYAERILAVYRPGDMIWVHDYHLMLLPALLRENLPGASIGFFLHIPFPSFELFRLLPNKWRKEILTGLLGADLIGFHTNNYAQYFLKSVQQILGYDISMRTVMTRERAVTVDTFPVSIDYEKFSRTFNDHGVYEERNKIKRKLSNAKIVLSVDRLDYAKGIVSRLKGYELFLEQHPEFAKSIVYILIVVPSRDIMAKYHENKKDLEGIVSKINGRFGNIDWTPVIYQYRSIDFKRLCALYISADVALITPLRDGLNLVAKEFIAARRDKRGVLILSETAGASAELGEALIVNPTDKQETADALLTALNMPVEEQMERNNEMQKRLQNYDVVKWAEDFISQLIFTKSKQKLLHFKEVSPRIESEILSCFCNSKKRIIFLDYDGTLIPFAKLPHLAKPHDKLLNLLQHFAADKKNMVVLISGRPKEVLESWFGSLPINIVAEHGVACRDQQGQWMEQTTSKAEWKKSVMQIMNLFTDRCAGTFVEEKTLSLAWHYRNAEMELGFLRSRELINSLSELASHLDFHVLEGEKVVEARTRGIDKGIAAQSFLNRDKYDFVLAIGDDKTDEDLFSVIPQEGYSIRVGLFPSKAKFNFIQQEDVIGFLNKLASAFTLEVHE